MKPTNPFPGLLHAFFYERLVQRKRSANPSIQPTPKMRTLRPDQQRGRRGGYGLAEGRTVPGAG